MPQLRNKPTNNVIVRVRLLFILLFVLSLVFLQAGTLKYLFDENQQENWNVFAKSFIPPQNNCGHEEAFEFIPRATVDKWAQTEFLIVFGVPSVDNDERRRRRSLQRATCWTFPGVATRANGHSGSLLVLYALARHPAHGFALSESLRLEAEQWHDIINLPMNEGRVTTDKKIGEQSRWGNEAEIGMSRKAFFWYQLALRAFPLAVYVGKCDDDMFMNVPQYLADLRLLPRQRTYWGAYVRVLALKNKQMERVEINFMVGYCITLARDVAKVVANYEPLRRIVALPYSKERELDFLILSMDLEDSMVGRVIKETGYPAIFVAEDVGCRFHNCGKEVASRNFSEHSVVAHHLKEEEYLSFMSFIIKNNSKIQNTVLKKESPTLFWVQCPLK